MTPKNLLYGHPPMKGVIEGNQTHFFMVSRHGGNQDQQERQQRHEKLQLNAIELH